MPRHGNTADAAAKNEYLAMVLLVDDQAIIGEAIRRALASEADSQGLYQSMRGERAFVHSGYMMFREGKITDAKLLEAMDYDNRIPKPFRYLFPNTFVRDYPESLRLQNELVQATQMRDEAQTEAFRKLRDESAG